MELLICINGNGNSVQAGHIIEAMPDGWPWCAAERGNPNWRIVSAPITAIEADALKVLSGSAIKLDIDSLPDAMTRADLYARVIK